MTYALSISLVIAGAIHLLPLTGLLGASQLNTLYGVNLVDPNLVILMRHRAVLFALLGAFLVYAAFKPSLQSSAISAGLISTLTFLWLALSSDGYNAQLSMVVYADVTALACLIVAAIAKWRITSD